MFRTRVWYSSLSSAYFWPENHNCYDKMSSESQEPHRDKPSCTHSCIIFIKTTTLGAKNASILRHKSKTNIYSWTAILNSPKFNISSPGFPRSKFLKIIELRKRRSLFTNFTKNSSIWHFLWTIALQFVVWGTALVILTYFMWNFRNIVQFAEAS